MRYDFIVIGGGIVGAATARQLQQTFPGRSILLIEKEASGAKHQTGRNSGVIHAGVYYTPGSLKARFCKAGAAATYDFCREHNLPVEGVREIRNSLLPAAYLREAQKYCPQLTLDDFAEHPPGIRAQAVDKSGRLMSDFIFVRSARSLHVCNAPSPAATSALPIAHHIVEQISAAF